MTTTTLRLPPRIAHLPQLRQIVRGGLAARGSVGMGLAAKAGGAGNGLLNSLVAYWPLNEAAGANNALDLHTNGLTLTQAASPGSAAGKVYAGARTFDGSTQYFSRASEALLQTGDVDFAFAAWVYPLTLASIQDYLVKWNGAGSERSFLIGYLATSSRFRFVINTPAAATVAVLADNFGVPATGQWYFIVAWHDAVSDTINIQINDTTSNSQATSAGVKLDTNPLELGAIANFSRFSTSRIGPVAMWKSAAGAGGALSKAQRTALYNSGAGLAYSAFTT